MQEKFYVIISLDFLYSIASSSFTSESVGWCLTHDNLDKGPGPGRYCTTRVWGTGVLGGGYHDKSHMIFLMMYN